MNISKKTKDFYVYGNSEHCTVDLSNPGYVCVKVKYFTKLEDRVKYGIGPLNGLQLDTGNALVATVPYLIGEVESALIRRNTYSYSDDTQIDITNPQLRENIIEHVMLMKKFTDELLFAIGEKLRTNGLKIEYTGFLTQKLTLKYGDNYNEAVQKLIDMPGDFLRITNIKNSHSLDDGYGNLKIHKRNLILILKTCLGLI